MAGALALFIPEAHRHAADRRADTGGLMRDVPTHVHLSCCRQGTALAPPPFALLAARGSETVLLVDDEPAVLCLGGVVLRHYGYEVLLAVDGEQAVDLYRQHGHRIALVILDVALPRLSGGDALRRLRQTDPDVRALLISGYPEAQGTAVDTPGVCGFLAKPFRGRDLAAVVRAVLDRGRSGSSADSTEWL